MKKILLATGIALLPMSVLAKQLTFPEMYQVLKVNGEEHKSGFFESETELELGSGRHIIEYRYSEIFEDDDVDDHIKIKSEPFVLDITLGQDAKTIKNPNNLDVAQAKAYAKQPKLTFVEKDGSKEMTHNIMSIKDYEQTRYQSLLDTTQAVKRNLPTAAVAPASKQHVAREQTTNKSQAASKVAEQKVNSRALEMLNYWWQQASEQERAAFLSQLKGDN